MLTTYSEVSGNQQDYSIGLRTPVDSDGTQLWYTNLTHQCALSQLVEAQRISTGKLLTNEPLITLRRNLQSGGEYCLTSSGHRGGCPNSSTEQSNALLKRRLMVWVHLGVQVFNSGFLVFSFLMVNVKECNLNLLGNRLRFFIRK